MTKEKIVQLLREQLKRHRPGGVTLEVLPDRMRQQGDYWYVPILPSSQPPKMYEYYEALAEVESTLEEDENLQILLVPVVPEEEEVSPSEGVAT